MNGGEKDKKDKKDAKPALTTNVTVDVNQAIDQAEALIDKLFENATGETTNVAIAVTNNTGHDLKLIGGFQWQGKVSDPADDIAAGKSGGWLIHSNGLDGSFSAQIWRMNWPAGLPKPYLTIGELVYMMGAQSKFTALLDTMDRYGDGAQSDKKAMLKLLDEGRGTGWTTEVNLPGPGKHEHTRFEVKTRISSKSSIQNSVSYVVVITQL